ncbi:putative E3 ubiquitin-protein ligase XBAT31 [Camellia lanceoleosa]|uniref:E3 ubiquitin-protein ligase XBAT31 n=2 Tax=Camellia lanceoleosa TaxID=1840588 RepID=A0ACC0FB33_9ERIC|nr:putative E3 ubiquitin-protein ligase XBAT31 [Camellia lanceoleosa]KAI7984621.1 putative E3 ubiquitin-protein ligase XBAT31 [Camellia lanceoleosa]
MGQGLSCAANYEHGLYTAVQFGDLETVETLLQRDPTLINQTTVYDRHSSLHIAAANGQIEIVSMLLDRSIKPDLLNRHKQTPLMLAAMHGKISCVQKLIEAGANILMFDSIHGRTCLHYAAYYGHSDCLQAILSSARHSHVAASWGYTRFVNIRDGKGATPLHLAARQRRPECVHILLDNGALVCASTGGYGFPGSTPLHLAARGGSLDCIRELLAWGADRLQRDSSGRIPYMVALKHKHVACAALLNPSSAEPLVWPSPLKFISELNAEAKALLEQALMEANREREKTILKGTDFSLPSPSYSDTGVDDNISESSDTELCCICFDQVCTIEVQDCGHQMCAQCTLALCCHNKPNPTTTCLTAPVCPFCRSSIAQLAVAKVKTNNVDADHDITSSKLRRSRKSKNFSEGSSSFKSLSAMGSFGKMGGRGSGRIAAENEWVDKS